MMESLMIDAVLPRVAMRCRTTPAGFPRYCRDQDHGEDDADNFLGLLPVLRETCSAWRIIIDSRVEYSAIRLAQWDLQQLIGARWSAAEVFVRYQFDLNVDVLAKSWSLQSPVCVRLRTLPLIQLSITELASLRDLLRQASSVEVEARRGHRYAPANMFWFTPLERV